MRAQQCPGRHIWVCALLVPAQQECKQGRDTVAFSYLISSNQPRRKDNSVSSVSTLGVHVLWQRKEMVLFAGELKNRE